jgi:hypothetical protein
MYNLAKWLGETTSLGIQMSFILGTLRYLSVNEGVTVRKV